MPSLYFISIHGGAGIAIKSESLGKKKQNHKTPRILEKANPFFLSSSCLELTQNHKTLILKLFQERNKKKEEEN